MSGVLEGFATLGAVIGLGMLLAHIGLLDRGAQVLLSRLAFFVATPALMVTVLARADVADVLSRNLVASAGAVAVTALLYVALAVLVWHKRLTDGVVGMLCSVYVNAGNLGLPIASYVLGDAALIAPMLLVQLLVMQPTALTVLDSAVSGRRFSVPGTLRRVVSNPLTMASLAGLLLALTGARLPALVAQPLALVGGMAVPGMLLAYGVSLRLGPLPGRGAPAVEVGTITVLKLVVQPLAAYLIGRFALGLDRQALFAITVIAALPTAQNIFVHAPRYQRGELVARDAIFVTTVLSVPVLLVIAALLA